MTPIIVVSIVGAALSGSALTAMFLHNLYLVRELRLKQAEVDSEKSRYNTAIRISEDQIARREEVQKEKEAVEQQFNNFRGFMENALKQPLNVNVMLKEDQVNAIAEYVRRAMTGQSYDPMAVSMVTGRKPS